jgi:hydroxymethylpyrimidine/phosphomethylpyrimidine kinase
MLIHMWNSNGFVSYLLNHPRVKMHWEDYIYHPFVTRLGDGKLDPDVFKHYMIQDYLFLVRHFHIMPIFLTR